MAMHKGIGLAMGVLLAMASVPPTASAQTDDRAKKLIAGFLDAYEHVQTYIGKIDVETHARGKTLRSKYLLALEKPNKTAMTVVDNPNLRAAEGTKIVWFGGPTVDVRTHFFGFNVKLSPRYDDPRLCGARGDNMRDLSIVTAVAMTRNPGSRFRFVKDDTVIGRPMHVVEVRSPKLLHGIDHELLWLDDKLHLPFRRDMVGADGQVAYHVAVETFKFDTRLPPDTFRAD